MSKREQRKKRKNWKHSQRESRERRQIDIQPLETPPDSPSNDLNETPQTSKQSAAGKRERVKTRQRRSREMKTLKTKLSKAQKENHKLRKQIWRIKQKKKYESTPCESPRTTTEGMMHGRNTSSPSVKKTLLFHNALMKEFSEGKQSAEPLQRSHAKSKNLLLSGMILKKYRLLYKMRLFGLMYKTLRPKESKVRRSTYLQTIKQTIQNFFLLQFCTYDH